MFGRGHSSKKMHQMIALNDEFQLTFPSQFGRVYFFYKWKNGTSSCAKKIIFLVFI